MVLVVPVLVERLVVEDCGCVCVAGTEAAEELLVTAELRLVLLTPVLLLCWVVVAADEELREVAALLLAVCANTASGVAARAVARAASIKVLEIVFI